MFSWHVVNKLTGRTTSTYLPRLLIPDQPILLYLSQSGKWVVDCSFFIVVSALLKTFPVYTPGPTSSVCSLPASIWVSVCPASLAQDLRYCLYSANSTGLMTALSTSCPVLHFPALRFYKCTSSLPARRHWHSTRQDWLFCLCLFRWYPDLLSVSSRA